MEPRAGAPIDDLQQQQVQQSNRALALVANEIASLRRVQEDDKNLTEGSLGYLRGQVRLLVFLARACDTFTVTLCQGQLGRELYDDLKRAGDVGRSLMSQIGFPNVMTNRLAYGLAAGAWGGRDVDHAPDHALLAADFPWTSQEAFDAWVPPTRHRMVSTVEFATAHVDGSAQI